MTEEQDFELFERQEKMLQECIFFDHVPIGTWFAEDILTLLEGRELSYDKELVADALSKLIKMVKDNKAPKYYDEYK